MLPHPTTMPFAWEEDVLRCTRVLLCILVFGIIALIGAPAVVHRARGSGPVATEEVRAYRLGHATSFLHGHLDSNDLDQSAGSYEGAKP